MRAILASVPLHLLSKVSCSCVEPAEAAVLLCIRIQHNPICACFLDANPVVCEALCRVEVKDEHQAGTLKDDNLVTLVLERDVCLR